VSCVSTKNELNTVNIALFVYFLLIFQLQKGRTLQLSRRKFVQCLGGTILVAASHPVLASVSRKTQPRALTVTNLHTSEVVESRYFANNDYVARELRRLNYICRDFRSDSTHPMDTKLFDQIVHIQRLLEVDAEVELISGYRSPKTNAMLRKTSSGVAKKSYHMKGQAIDFRLKGVNLADIRDAAKDLKAGGVGFYPDSQFVHIDTGPVRSW
jgi:uncharacterized protein YcbK (DUF882 family)